MNYLAQGIAQGWDAGSRAVEEQRKRKAQSAESAADRALRLDLDAKLTDRETALQNARLLADADRQFKQQGWQSAENSMDRSFRSDESGKDRGWRTTERLGSEGHDSSEKNLDRMLHQKLQQDQLDQAARQFADKQAFDYTHLATDTAGKTRSQNWAEDLTNPENVYRQAHADYLKSRPGEAPDLPPLPGAAQSLANANKSMAKAAGPVTVTTQAEYNALPKGARFIWNGQTGTKP